MELDPNPCKIIHPKVVGKVSSSTFFLSFELLKISHIDLIDVKMNCKLSKWNCCIASIQKTQKNYYCSTEQRLLFALSHDVASICNAITTLRDHLIFFNLLLISHKETDCLCCISIITAVSSVSTTQPSTTNFILHFPLSPLFSFCLAFEWVSVGAGGSVWFSLWNGKHFCW